MSNQFDLNNFNSFLNKASQSIMCNSECREQKKSEKLKQDFLDAQVNLASAPHELEMAEKNYVIFKKGELEYNEMIDSKLEKKAEFISKKFKENFNDDVAKIKTQLETYNGLLLNFKNVVELYINYKRENRELFKQLKDDTNDVLINERKTYYEDQEVDKLEYYYYYILLVIYYICAFCFIIFSFIYPSQTNWKIQIGIFVVLLILPYISTWILGMIIYLIYKIFNMLPKNVYK
jgi:hypothetical protein